ncbi:syntaxin-19 [Chiloscyllium plagiosum]|uniref:syntaxin-19 n=1 Tax=Chiloscyllium plagiosum TaxID=36176 RepID=UPI001CB7B93D|nr:syntaxin-19 [Chiloscyllium plagiosum]
MKDRLQELRQRAKEAELKTGNEGEESKQTEDSIYFKQQAIIFEKEPVMENFLLGAQKIQDEINELNNDVKKLSQQSTTMASTRRFSIIKKDSSNLVKEIKLQAESIHKHLDTLSKDAQQSEAEAGEDAIISRMKRTQYLMLLKQYQTGMSDFNTVLNTKQENCKKFIQRQLEVVGKEVSEEELNNMVEHDKWYVFNENFLSDVKITKGHLSEIETRHKELINLENQIKELQDLFVQISVLVHEQGDFLNNIERAVLNTKEYTEKGKDDIKLAVKLTKKNLCRKLCCWCFPCCA